MHLTRPIHSWACSPMPAMMSVTRPMGWGPHRHHFARVCWSRGAAEGSGRVAGLRRAIADQLMAASKGGAAASCRRCLPSSPLIRPFLFLVTIFSSVLLLLLVHQKGTNYISRTRTVVGHNLEPTPWHLFQPKHFAPGATTYTQILHCSYLSCASLPAWSSSPNTTTSNQQDEDPPPFCPFSFRWIHEDLVPWAKSGISMADLMEAQKHAAMRVLILGGRLYVDFYYACVQSRAMFTLWGILQLLRRYPGVVPDVDLMFDCMDRPVLNKTLYDPGQRPPPPLFRYCTTPQHYDIPFPDWSFWGWPEVNVGPWDEEFANIKAGSQAESWSSKLPIAYWKGNPDVDSPVRMDLLKCNDSTTWEAQILRQDWEGEVKAGFEQSKLSGQCRHRYKIYAEGYAWSVSLKYILSCGSLALIIDPEYEDFFSRGLKPRQHYWPVTREELCRSIKFAVNWANDHPSEAEAIGKGGQDYMEELNMEMVYDYMYHLIMEYHKLQNFKLVRPPSAQEICEESVLCYADEKQKQFLQRSFALPSSSSPCVLPSPNHHLIEDWLQYKQKTVNDLDKFNTISRRSEYKKVLV